MVLRPPAALAAALLAASLAHTAPFLTAGSGGAPRAAPPDRTPPAAPVPQPTPSAAPAPGASSGASGAATPRVRDAAVAARRATGAAHGPPVLPSVLPPVTEIRIDKSEHTLDLVAGGEIVRSYRVALGPGGAGPKRYEGDRRTPVGTYRVAGRIDGLFHRFLIVSYPNDEDRARFAELKRRGEVPPGRGVGHGIGIHGVGSAQLAGVHKASDWTLGCIALDDDEMDEIARRTPDGAKIVITD
ncbi:L,D-transpeptidase family protein [Sorangium sp. So ce1000]|uniref:L,D-transpeptidase family protein n=1 Tax=Sorangium sp. So ce1000 TaxID=3133325 RepID=UPI003F610970